MQTMTPPSWPAPVGPPVDGPPTPPPPAARRNRKVWALVVVIAFFGGVAALGSSSNTSSEGVPSTYRTGTGTSSTYTYRHGDYPNGWTESQVDDSIRGLVASGVSTESGACLLRYVIDHYTPSEFLASDKAALARQAMYSGC